MRKTSEIGNSGEDVACNFLAQNKYKILDKNYRKPWGEIDIVAKSPDETLVFIEVKALSVPAERCDFKPEDHFNRSKYKKLIRTISLYTGERDELINKNKGWRLDLIAINFDANKSPEIRHYKNVFF